MSLGQRFTRICDFKNVKFQRFNTEAKPSFFENGGFNVCASQFFHLLDYYTDLKYLLIDQKPRSSYISKKKNPSLFLLCSFYYIVPLTIGVKNFNPRFFSYTFASKISGIQKKLFIGLWLKFKYKLLDCFYILHDFVKRYKIRNRDNNTYKTWSRRTIKKKIKKASLSLTHVAEFGSLLSLLLLCTRPLLFFLFFLL